MPLFKISNISRQKKVLCDVETLDELMSTAKDALELPEGIYKVVMDEDGSCVPNTKVLLSLANAFCNKIIVLLIISSEDEWKQASAEQPVPKPTPITGILDNTEDDAQNQRPAQSCRIASSSQVMPLPWDKFPDRLLKACEEKLIPSKSDRMLVVGMVASYAVENLKDTNRRTAFRLSEDIVYKYPDSFQDRVGNSVVGNGVKTLFLQIYNRINYIKQGSSKSRKRRARENDEEEEEDESTSVRSPSETDVYGCVSFNPSLPATETEDTQENKKSWLKEQSFTHERDERVAAVMRETYPSQRTAIIHRKSNDYIKDVLLQWPLLEEPEYFIEHASMLVGFQVKERYQSNLEKYGHVEDFLQQFCMDRKASKDRSKNSPQINSVMDLLESIKAANKNTRSKTATSIAILPLVTLYFQESLELLYILTNDLSTGEQIEKLPSGMSPVLVINGQSLFDETARCCVIIEKRICIEARNVLEGMMVTFLSYYVFSLRYPTKLSKTLEFMQRAIMGINPPTGNKRESGAKRKTKDYEVNVISFINKLRQQENMWRI